MKKYSNLKKSQRVYLFFKRGIDIFGSLLGIILLFPLFFIFILISKFSNHKQGVFFIQKRVGRNNKIFNIYKFKTMYNKTNPNLSSETIGDPYIACFPFGKFLRKHNIDEWPQLFNILKGDMSFVGPRPLIQHDKDLITLKLRNDDGTTCLRPGITGLAQIKRKEFVDAKKKAQYDLEYMKNISFILDIKIFLRTLFK